MRLKSLSLSSSLTIRPDAPCGRVMVVSEALVKKPWRSGAPQLVFGGVYFGSVCAKAAGAPRAHKTAATIIVLFTVMFLLFLRADELRFSCEGSVKRATSDSALMQAIRAILGDCGSSTKEGDFDRSAPNLSADGKGRYDFGVATGVRGFGDTGFVHGG